MNNGYFVWYFRWCSTSCLKNDKKKKWKASQHRKTAINHCLWRPWIWPLLLSVYQLYWLLALSAPCERGERWKTDRQAGGQVQERRYYLVSLSDSSYKLWPLSNKMKKRPPRHPSSHQPRGTRVRITYVTVIASALPSMAPLSRTVSSVRVTAESADRESCFSRQLPEHKYTLLMDDSSDFTYFHRHILSTQPTTARVRFNWW